MPKILVTLFLCLFFVGCASYGTRIDEDAIGKIEKGKTTEAELIAALGKPMGVGVTPDGQKYLMYIYTRAQVKASTMIPIVGLFAGGTDTNTQSLQVWIDQNGVVSSYGYNDTNSEINTGLLSN